MTETFETGQAIRLTAIVKDNGGSQTDPDLVGGDYQIDITITDASEDTEEVSASSMVRENTGRFHYDWQTTESTKVGQFEIKIKSTVSDNDIIQKDFIKLQDVIDE